MRGPDGKMLRDAAGNAILKGSPEAAALEGGIHPELPSAQVAADMLSTVADDELDEPTPEPPHDFLGAARSLTGGLTAMLSRAAATETDPGRHAALATLEMAAGDLKAKLGQIEHEFSDATDGGLAITLLRSFL